VEVVTDPDAEIIGGAGLITKASMIALRERCRKQSEKLERGVALRHSMRRIGAPQHWVAVFEDVLSGRIRCQLLECDSASLTDALVIDSNDFARRMPRRSNDLDVRGIEISCQVAAKLIGTTPMAVSSAVKARLIKGKLRGRDYFIPLEQVLKFQSEFMVAEELREIFGGHQRSICCELDGAGVKPAATVNRVRVWRRSDIERHVDQVGESALKLAQRQRTSENTAS
jgi:hypothetical protein